MTDAAVSPSLLAAASTALVPPSSTSALTVAAAREVLAKHARSFRFAGLFLPSGRLDVAAVVYAFCRVVDDAIDDAPSLAAAEAEARALDDELHRRTPPRPAVAAFLEMAVREDLDIRYAAELVRGVAGDAVARLQVADDAELLRYCYRVAGTVGGLMCGVLGVRDRRALPHAIDLGIAMQLTNICRDVLEDARRGRAYLPARRLVAAGIDADAYIDDVAAGRASVFQTATVVRGLLALAERYYASADAGMRFIPWRSRFAILVASRVYRAIGTKLLANGADPLPGRTSTTTMEKIAGAVAALGRFFVLPTVPHDPSLHEGLRDLPGTHGDS
jgi:phytoene synthase